MGIFKLFSKKKPEVYPHYSQSSHASTYEEIAKKFGTTPQHVYEIAHGKGIGSYDDRVIVNELIEAKIIGQH